MKLLVSTFLFCMLWSCAPFGLGGYQAEISKFQTQLNKEYLDTATTPLRGENLKKFRRHPFFAVDKKFRVTAKLERAADPVIFDLPTSSGKSKQYKEYGTASFQIDGKNYQLKLYQSLDLMMRPEYQDYLFLPFRDETNGKTTYGGGKYLDLRIPSSDKIIIDFNKSYHPFCAYNAYDYNCPIVPEENILPVAIEAGVMYDDVYYD